MFIKPCPHCGRLPHIIEGLSYKNGTRRRYIYCPNYCSVIKLPSEYSNYSFLLAYTGDGDDNMLYKMWNNNLIKREE